MKTNKKTFLLLLGILSVLFIGVLVSVNTQNLKGFFRLKPVVDNKVSMNKNIQNVFKAVCLSNEKPSLSEPPLQEGMYIDISNVKFVWKSVPNADSYVLNILKPNNSKYTKEISVTEVSLTKDDLGGKPGNFKWYVEAKFNNCSNTQSETKSFDIVNFIGDKPFLGPWTGPFCYANEESPLYGKCLKGNECVSLVSQETQDMYSAKIYGIIDDMRIQSNVPRLISIGGLTMAATDLVNYWLENMDYLNDSKLKAIFNKYGLSTEYYLRKVFVYGNCDWNKLVDAIKASKNLLDPKYAYIGIEAKLNEKTGDLMTVILLSK